VCACVFNVLEESTPLLKPRPTSTCEPRLAAHLVCTVPAVSIILYTIVLLFDFYIPILGRSQTALGAELTIAACTCLASIELMLIFVSNDLKSFFNYSEFAIICDQCACITMDMWHFNGCVCGRIYPIGNYWTR
jgi:hypothetical protein